MPALALGVSFRRAPVELLERLAISEDDEPKAYRRLLELGSVTEGLVLSTCNRVEVYAEVDGYHQGFQDLKRFLAAEVPVEEIAEPLYSHYDEQAAEHLFAVASGLDSMVLGEPQILAQVRSAFRRAVAESAVGRALSPLFEHALRAGKRARAETAIGASPAAFVEAGARVAEGFLGDLRGRSLLVVGSGKMGALAMRALLARGLRDAVVLSRRQERAERLAERVGARAGSLADLGRYLRDADLVVSSTGASGTVVTREDVRRALDGRERPMFLLDLAVPRDVDPDAAALPGVAVADVDDLRPVVAEMRAGAEDEAERAMAIVREEARRYSARRRAARIAPLIEALHERGERVREAELRRLAGRLAELDDRERAAVDALTRGIVRKLLHGPVVRLKDLAASGADTQARALAELLGLDATGGARGGRSPEPREAPEGPTSTPPTDQD